MTDETSSADPQALLAYADAGLRIAAQLEASASRLAGALAGFAATCTEYPLGIDASLADPLRALARRSVEHDLWVRRVGEQFVLADAGAVADTGASFGAAGTAVLDAGTVEAALSLAGVLLVGVDDQLPMGEAEFLTSAGETGSRDQVEPSGTRADITSNADDMAIAAIGGIDSGAQQEFFDLLAQVLDTVPPEIRTQVASSVATVWPALQQAGGSTVDFLYGFMAEFEYVNTWMAPSPMRDLVAPGGGESAATTVGRLAADGAVLVQAGGEILQGDTAMVGGWAACFGTGVGCVAVAPAMIIGGVLIADGVGTGVAAVLEWNQNMRVWQSRVQGGGDAQGATGGATAEDADGAAAPKAATSVSFPPEFYQEIHQADPTGIGFSQDSASYKFNRGPFAGQTIDDLAEGLRNGSIDPNSIPPIRITERWGRWVSIDNRRLEAFRRAGVEIRYQVATPEDVAHFESIGRFSSVTEGTSIDILGQP